MKPEKMLEHGWAYVCVPAKWQAASLISMACNQIIPSQISKFSTTGKSQFTNSLLLSALKHGSTNLCKVLNS